MDLEAYAEEVANHRRTGARRAWPPDAASVARRHCRAPGDDVLALGQGHRHCAGGPDLAGDLLSNISPTWSRRSRCSPRAWWTRRGSLPAELVGGDWSEDASWGTGVGGDGGLSRLLEGQPRRLPGGRPGDRGRRRAAAGHPCASAERRHRRPGPGDRRRLAFPRGRAGREPRAHPPVPTRWPWPARSSPCSPASPHTATASSSGASGRGNLIDTQARTLHWAVTGRQPPPAEIPRRESTRPRTGPLLGGATVRGGNGLNGPR